MPFNGTNPHSVVVVDNCSIHHCDEVLTTLRDIGVIVHFLRPYSPDFNPIEEVFSEVKTQLRALCSQSLEVKEAVLASFCTIIC